MNNDLPKSPEDMPFAFCEKNPNWHYERDSRASEEHCESVGEWRIIIETNGARIDGTHHDFEKALWYAATLAEHASMEWLEQRHGESPLLGSADGVANLVDQLGAIGNGQVPAVVRVAWRILGPDHAFGT